MTSSAARTIISLSGSLTGISRGCFAEMQSDASLALTAPYHAEEARALENTLRRFERQGVRFDQIVVIGCAQLRYADLALRHGIGYTAVDPNLDDHLDADKMSFIRDHSNVTLVRKSFSDLSREDLPKGKKLYFFLFNVFPYIKDGLETQKRLASPGDAAVISTWNGESLAARRLRDVYYCRLRDSFSKAALPGRLDMDRLEGECDGFSASQRRLRGKYTDILVVKM